MKPDDTVARCYAAVMGVDWDTVEDWYVDGTELVLVVSRT